MPADTCSTPLLPALHTRLDGNAHPKTLKVEFRALERDITLHLEQNTQFFANDYKEVEMGPDGSILRVNKNPTTQCFYKGRVEGHEKSVVTASTCDGHLRASIADETHFYAMELHPDHSTPTTTLSTGSRNNGNEDKKAHPISLPHIVYEFKNLDYSEHEGEHKCKTIKPAVSREDDINSVVDVKGHPLASDPSEQHMRILSAGECDGSVTKYLEVLVVNDKSRYDAKGETVQTSTSNIMNHVDTLYQSHNFDCSIRILVRGQVTFTAGNPSDMVYRPCNTPDDRLQNSHNDGDVPCCSSSCNTFYTCTDVFPMCIDNDRGVNHNTAACWNNLSGHFSCPDKQGEYFHLSATASQRIESTSASEIDTSRLLRTFSYFTLPGGGSSSIHDELEDLFGGSIDAVHLLTHVDFAASTIGLAYVSGSCNKWDSAGISMATQTDAYVGATVTHEIGHNLGMRHDASSGKIMSPVISNTVPTEFTSESLAYSLAYFVEDYGTTLTPKCMENNPGVLDADRIVCGNGIIEEGEDCETVFGVEDDDPCCNYNTCQETCSSDPCNGKTCNNRGTCSGGVCTCQTGYDGDDCEYTWATGSFGPCQGECPAATGTQSRTVVCQHITTGTVADSFCTDIAGGKPSTSQGCPLVCTDPCEGVSCGDFGTCEDGICECQANNTGNACQYYWHTTAYSACSVTCGTGTQTRNRDCYSTLTGADTNNDALCTGLTAPAIERSCVLPPCDACEGVTCSDFGSCANGICECEDGYGGDSCEFVWQVGNYSSCSVECGGGTRTRTVNCYNVLEGQVVDKPNCIEDNVEPAGEEECNTQICEPPPDTPYWNVSSFSDCSVVCGDGEQTRTVTCMLQGEAVSESQCLASEDAGVKPDHQRLCSLNDCVWHISSYSVCSHPCNGGTQIRNVTCVNPNVEDGLDNKVADTLCDSDKPVVSRQCNTGSCYWKGESWEDCDSVCGGGVQSRSVCCANPNAQDECLAIANVEEQSVRSSSSSSSSSSTPRHSPRSQVVSYDPYDYCARNQELPVERECNVEDCEWQIGEWSECSAQCGGGQIERSVACINPNNKLTIAEVEDEECSDIGPKPNHTEVCNEFSCSTPYWIISGYGNCTRECDGGVKTARLVCFDPEEEEEAEDPSICANSTLPKNLEIECNTHACDPCAEIDCGDHGRCVVEEVEIEEGEEEEERSVMGNPYCSCQLGYTGDLCDELPTLRLSSPIATDLSFQLGQGQQITISFEVTGDIDVVHIYLLRHSTCERTVKANCFPVATVATNYALPSPSNGGSIRYGSAVYAVPTVSTTVQAADDYFIRVYYTNNHFVDSPTFEFVGHCPSTSCENGSCNGGICVCPNEVEYSGNSCEFFRDLCDNVDCGLGECVIKKLAPVCDCSGTDRWGSRCQLFECDVKCKHGEPNTRCSTCLCDGNWDGDACDECPLDADCGENGRADSDCEECVCKNGWTGDFCTEKYTAFSIRLDLDFDEIMKNKDKFILLLLQELSSALNLVISRLFVKAVYRGSVIPVIGILENDPSRNGTVLISELQSLMNNDRSSLFEGGVLLASVDTGYGVGDDRGEGSSGGSLSIGIIAAATALLVVIILIVVVVVKNRRKSNNDNKKNVFSSSSYNVQSTPMVTTNSNKNNNNNGGTKRSLDIARRISLNQHMYGSAGTGQYGQEPQPQPQYQTSQPGYQPQPQPQQVSYGYSNNAYNQPAPAADPVQQYEQQYTEPQDDEGFEANPLAAYVNNQPRQAEPEGDPLPFPWQIYYTDDGDIYYYNTQTAESVWERPLV